MKETGIIMSGDHPVKCLNGTKTVTRRTWGLKEINKDPDRWVRASPVDPRQLLHSAPRSLWRFEDKNGKFLIIKCPYGGVGDKLWMKETWSHFKDSLCDYETAYYKASNPNLDVKWRSSMFMHRWASRGLFEILPGLRPERLQEITAEDCRREGIDGRGILDPYIKNDYKVLWDSLNAKRGYGWSVNPWVWVITFKTLGKIGG